MRTLKLPCVLSILLLLSLSFIFSCHSGHNPSGLDQKNWGNKKKSFNLDASDIDSRDRYDINDIFDSIHYTPLQTTKESMFSNIDQLEVTNKYFVILDWASKSILVFKKDGTFKFKMTSKDISDLAVDDSKEHIVFQDKLLRKVFTYDFNGKLIDTLKSPFNYTGMVYVDSAKIAYCRYFSPDNDIKIAPSNILITDGRNNIKHGFMPYDTTAIVYTEVRNSIKPFYKSNGNILFPQPYENKVYYNLNNDKTPDYFTIDLPAKYRLPEDFLVNPKYYKKRVQYLKDNPYQAYLIKNIYVVDSLMSLEVMSERWHDIFVYDLKKNKAISAFNFLSGPKNSWLPPGIHFLAADEKSFYRSTTSKQLFNLKQAHQSQSKFEKLPKEIKTFYQTQNNMSNPVIIQLTPRKNLNDLKKKA